MVRHGATLLIQAETQYGQIAVRTKSDFVFYFHSHLETYGIILVNGYKA